MKSRPSSLFKSVQNLSLAATLAIIAAVSGHATTVNSNGTGGGSWTTGSTWSGGVVPPNTDLWTIMAPDTVTAGYGVSFTNTSAYACAVSGTLNINSGATFTLVRLNSGLASGRGIVNVNGGTLISNDLLGSTGYTGTINISNGGFVSQTGSGIASVYTVNVNNGGAFSNAGGFFPGGSVNLAAGGVIEAPAGAAALPTLNSTFKWNGGTYVLNTNSYAVATSSLNSLMAALQNNASNVLVLSNQPSKQTITLGAATLSGSISPTQGNIVFNVYSPTTNDNDLITESNTTGANAAITLPLAVHLQIGNPTLSGDFASYTGISYKLFNTAGTYANINPTVDPTFWTINGVQYQVTWTNTLNSNGSLTVSTIEPPIGYGVGNHYTFAKDSNGFSIIPAGPSVTGTTIPAGVKSPHQVLYVSTLTGSDTAANGSQAAPFKTIAYALAHVRQGSSDWVLLHRGEVFASPTGTFVDLNPGWSNPFGTSTDPYYPQVLGAYGATGARPVLREFQFADNHTPLLHNYVIRDIQFDTPDLYPSNSFEPIWLSGNSYNVLIENCQFNNQVTLEGEPASGKYVSGVTIRRCVFFKCIRTHPNGGQAGHAAWGTTQPVIVNNRVSGIYQEGTVSFLLEDNVLDHSGWDDNYDVTGTDTTNTHQSPSEYSHNLYSGPFNYDMTVRNNISARAASMGLKLASAGAISGNVMVNNNIGAIIANTSGTSGCYLMVHDNLVIEGSANKINPPWGGALGWGISFSTPDSLPNPVGEVIRNMEVNSTPNFSTQALSTTTDLTWLVGPPAHTLLSGTNVVYSFGGAPNQNPTGSSYFDSTRTIESYNASIGGTATLADFFNHIDAQDTLTWNPAYSAQPIIKYMETGFNLALPTRTGTTVSFTGASFDLVRWDNPFNWSTNDIPGSVTNDVADIVAKEVIYDGTNSLARLQLENGAILDIDKGSLSLPGTESIRTVGTLGGTINLGVSGALSLANYTTANSPLTINVDGGLLSVGNNLGSGTNVHTIVNVHAGTAFLGSPGSGSHFEAGGSLNIIGSAANTIGYQTSAGTNTITFDSGGILSYTFDANGVTPISEFYGSTVTSALVINSATLHVDMSALTPTSGAHTVILAQVDSLTGSFGTVNIIPPANVTNAQVVYNYTAGTISLTYTAP